MAKTKRIQGASKGAGASRAAASDRVGDKPPTPTSVAVGDSPSEAPGAPSPRRSYSDVVRSPPRSSIGGGDVDPTTGGREGSLAQTPTKVVKGDENLLAGGELPQGSPPRGSTGRVEPEIGPTRGGSGATPPTGVANEVEVPKGPPIVPPGPGGGAELAGQQGPARGTPQNPPNRGDVPLGTPNDPIPTSWVGNLRTKRYEDESNPSRFVQAPPPFGWQVHPAWGSHMGYGSYPTPPSYPPNTTAPQGEWYPYGGGWFPSQRGPPPPMGHHLVSELDVLPNVLPENNTNDVFLSSQGQQNAPNDVAQGKPQGEPKSPSYSITKSSEQHGGRNDEAPDTAERHAADPLRPAGWPSSLHDLEARNDANPVTRAELMEYTDRLLKRMEGIQRYQATPPLTPLRLQSAKMKAPKAWSNSKDNGDVELFLESLAAYLATESDEDVKVKYATSYLDGDALAYWLVARRLLVADGREVTFALLCETLKDHFSPAHREHTAALELLRLREKPGQYDEYRRQFDALRAKLPTDRESLVELLLVTLFKKGLQPSTASHVMLDPTTGSKHLHLRSLQEQAKVAADMAGQRNVTDAKDEDKKAGAGPSHSKRGKRRWQSSERPAKKPTIASTSRPQVPSKPPPKENRCYNCQGVGHMASACPSAKKQPFPAGDKGTKPGKGGPRH